MIKYILIISFMVSSLFGQEGALCVPTDKTGQSEFIGCLNNTKLCDDASSSCTWFTNFESYKKDPKVLKYKATLEDKYKKNYSGFLIRLKMNINRMRVREIYKHYLTLDISKTMASSLDVAEVKNELGNLFNESNGKHCQKHPFFDRYPNLETILKNGMDKKDLVVLQLDFPFPSSCVNSMEMSTVFRKLNIYQNRCQADIEFIVNQQSLFKKLETNYDHLSKIDAELRTYGLYTKEVSLKSLYDSSLAQQFFKLRSESNKKYRTLNLQQIAQVDKLINEFSRLIKLNVGMVNENLKNSAFFFNPKSASWEKMNKLKADFRPWDMSDKTTIPEGERFNCVSNYFSMAPFMYNLPKKGDTVSSMSAQDYYDLHDSLPIFPTRSSVSQDQ